MPSDKPPDNQDLHCNAHDPEGGVEKCSGGVHRGSVRKAFLYPRLWPLLGTAVSGSAGTILKGQGVAKHAIAREIQVRDVWPFLAT